MDDILLTSALLQGGLSHDDLAQLHRTGELVRVRRGAYARTVADQLDPEERHRRLVVATAPQLREGAVLSHTSAALLHGLPLLGREDLSRVHVTRDRRGGGRRRRLVQVHGSPLAAEDIVDVQGLSTTSLARTVVDLARTLPFDRAVAAGDRALRLGLAPDDLAAAVERAAHATGVRKARRVAGFVDARSETPGESISRVRCHEQGLPAPDLQRDIFDRDGQWVARVDFCWPGLRTIGEFDGKIKYGRLVPAGQSIEDVIFSEKIREDALRSLGWQVVRWIWADLYADGVIRTRVERAFARGRLAS